MTDHPHLEEIRPQVVVAPPTTTGAKSGPDRSLVVRVIITAGGLAVGTAVVAQWRAVDLPLFLALAILTAGVQALAFRSRTSRAVISISFVPVAVATLVLGVSAGVFLGVFSVLYGEGVLRRERWGRMLEILGLLSLMLVFGGWIAVLEADSGLLAARATRIAMMGLWIVIFATWLMDRLRCRETADSTLAGGIAALVFVLAMLLAPFLPMFALEDAMGQAAITTVKTALVVAAGFMTIDLLATSVLALTTQGGSGLSLWRGNLVPTFYRYNGQVLLAGGLAIAFAEGGIALLAAGSLIVLLAFYAYRLMAEQRETLYATVCALTSALDARDSYTKGHSDRVASYSLAVGKLLGWGPGRLANLQLAGQLHDVGKIGTPDSVLRKPDKLTPEEFEVIKRHALDGESIVRNVPGLRSVARIVGQDHERWDGKGYPRGVSGQKLHLEARIIAVADVYDALTTDRPYRRALSQQQALTYLKEQAGKAFDPAAVEAFVQVHNQGNLEAALEFAYCLTH